jgi:Tfp pilus assembly protein PilF
MSESNKKGPSDGVDWDAALEEWDESAFSPEAAHPAPSNTPPVALRTGTPSDRSARPLYRPPAGSAASPGPPRVALNRPPFPPRPAIPPSLHSTPTRAEFAAVTGKTPSPPIDSAVDIFLDDELDDESPFPTPRPAIRNDEADAQGPTTKRQTSSPGSGIPEVEKVEPPSSAAAFLLKLPSVLAPETREHDPDAETSIGYRDPKLRALALERRQAQEARHESGPAKERPTPGSVPPASTRANWLEAEAAARSGAPRARLLLAASEICAIEGNSERAFQLASEARSTAPELLLAHKQARGLAAGTRANPRLAEILRDEANSTEAPEARLHASLFAADVLRLQGDDAGALGIWTQLSLAVPDDPRASVARVAHGLAHGELEALELFVDTPEAAPLRDGLLAALALRGAAAHPLPTSEAFANVAANDALRRVRAALDAHDIVTAAECFDELRRVPELARAASWLFAALGATQPDMRREAALALEQLARDGEISAHRALAARAIELSDPKLAEAALDGGHFSTVDRGVLRTLLNLDAKARAADSEALALAGAMAPLASAIAALTPVQSPSPGDGPEVGLHWIEGRADRRAGSLSSRAEVRLARLLTADAPPDAIAAAIAESKGLLLPEAAAIELELACRQEKWDRVAETLKAWLSDGGGGHPSDGALVAGLIAERAGDNEAAKEAYREARALDPKSETAVRALAALDPATDLAGALGDLADHLGNGVAGAMARLEAVMRAASVDDMTRADRLERAHRAAPSLPIAAFLGRRIARKARKIDELLRWIETAQTTDADPFERAADFAREALLLANRDPEAAAQRALSAHRARPFDLALRELYERLSPESTPDEAAWREQRAARATGDARAILYMEAAHRYELKGDTSGALRAAEAAVASADSVLARLARERAELDSGAAARLADELLAHARQTESPEERREAYARLADIDAVGRGDTASALLWHRSILEETPDYKPSLRYVEHALIGDGRDDELEPIATGIAYALDGAVGGEGVAHADFAARLRARGTAGSWDSTREVAEIGARQLAPSLSSQRLLNAHARSHRDDPLILTTTLALLARTTRPAEQASLLLRAGEAASRAGDLAHAVELLERAKTEDPGDIAAWGLLADVRKRAGDVRGAAEACEALARTSFVQGHRLPAWYDAARLWADDVRDNERALAALEQAAAIDVAYEDVFSRLSSLYASRGARNDLAALLERRIATITDPEEQVAMEVERGRFLAEVGDAAGARKALEAALEARPDHTRALSQFAELCAKEEDWPGAERAWVRLARLLGTPEEQRDAYARLGELYSVHSVNLSRAELAFKEVLKRSPGDIATLEQLVDIYKRLNDPPLAVDAAQKLILLARDAIEKRTRLIELAILCESLAHDTRRAEQVLEGARREFPTDAAVLRALAEFYTRHKQMPAVHVLLDRAAADARRAFAAGRFAPALFEIMRTVFELRDQKDASRVVAATLAAIEGQPAIVQGAGARALDPELDDKLAPDVLSPSLRALLARTGAALDAAVPVDLRAMQAFPLGASGAALQNLVNGLTSAAGLPTATIYLSPVLGRACVPASSDPPTLVVGEAVLSATDLSARTFMIVRAVKLIATHASALVRTPSADLAVLISAWLQAFNPNWTPQGVNPTALAAASRKVSAALPKKLPPELGMLALEVAGSIGMRASTLGAMALAWANRTALLAGGDPHAALEAIAWSHGAADGAPIGAEERGLWLSRTHEAKDLLTFSIGEAYGEVRSRLGLDG